MNKKHQKIGIAGLGYVGGAIKNWFEGHYRPKPELFLYDKYKDIGSPEELNKADIIFICVPTPYDKEGSYDDSEVRNALDTLTPNKIVIIKSTILPESTKQYQERYSGQTILFNPEFLRSKTANEDFLNPDRQIIGYTKKSKQLAQELFGILPKAPYRETMKSTAAELVKYFGNVFLATKVVLANQFYDLSEELGVDYEKVKEATGHDPRIGASHMDIWHGGYRGYGGGCLPKDVRAIIDLAKEKGTEMELVEKVKEINERLTQIEEIKESSIPLVKDSSDELRH